MLSDKQKEALKVVLELHKEGDMTNEQVMTVIEALTENTPTIQYYPWTYDKFLTSPWMTFKNEPFDVERYTTNCK